MQIVVVAPGSRALIRDGQSEEFLTQQVAGVPLFVRVIAMAVRAGMRDLLLVWPDDLSERIWEECMEHPALHALTVRRIVLPSFDPLRESSWAAIWALLEDEFVWLPWNFVTQSRMLALIEPSLVPLQWAKPVRLRKAVLRDAAGGGESVSLDISWDTEGVSVRSHEDIRRAEDFLVRLSGKPTDGLYSNFNRRLCRQAVRVLSHTRVTPNAVTLGGLVLAMLSAFLYSRGFYKSYVAGASLFFLSGLFDEMDGMLARLKFRESPFGTWFEGTVDNVTYLLVFSGMTVGLHREYGRGELVWGIALVAGCVLSALTVAVQRRRLTKSDRPHEYASRMNHLMETDANVISRLARQIHIFIKKGVAIHYVFIFTAIGALPVLVRIAAIAANLTWTLVSFFTWKFTRQTRTPSTRSYVPKFRETL